MLDFSMPGMDGNEVAQVLAKEFAALPVIVSTGCLNNLPDALGWFADAVLPKGEPDLLVSTLHRLLSAAHVPETPSPSIRIRKGE